jgi:hypothetical protein
MLVTADLTTRAALTPDENMALTALADIMSPRMGDQTSLPDNLKEAILRRAIARVDREIWPSAATQYFEVVRDSRGADDISWRSLFVSDAVYTAIRGCEREDKLTGLRVLVAHVKGQAAHNRFEVMQDRLRKLTNVPPLSVEFGQYDDNGKRVFYKGSIYTLVGEPPKLPPSHNPSVGNAVTTEPTE